MSILSIQSNVTTGHVGNAAACFPLQRMGFEVWAVDTVVLSNHPALRPPTGRRRTPEEISTLINGIAARGLLSDCAAVVSGYLGDVENGGAVIDAVRVVKKINNRALFLCDPVMGDDGKLYVGGDILEFYKDKAVDLADILTPNAFEAGLLVDREIRSRQDAIDAIRQLRRRSPEIVIITGMKCEKDQTCDNFIALQDGIWRITTPKVAVASHGAGDLLSALFIGKYLSTGNALASIADAVSGVQAALEIAAAEECEDMPVISAQDRILNPQTRYAPEAI